MVLLKDLKRYVALKIKVDFQSGIRAGYINPRDPGLRCYGWQNIDDGWEIRLVVDDRDIERYRNIEGVEIIEGVENIDRAIEEIMRDRMVTTTIYLPELFTASIISKQLNPTDKFDIHNIPNPPETDESLDVTRNRVLEYLMDQGVKGIRKVKRAKLLSELIIR